MAKTVSKRKVVKDKVSLPAESKPRTLRPWLKSTWQQWQLRLEQQQFPHALLISGALDLGKRDFAHLLIASLFCQHPNQEGLACNQCKACHWMSVGSHPDFLHIQPEESAQIKIDQIRTLTERFSMASQMNGWQVALIEPADVMTLEASNALLKTLEEPGTRTLLILITDYIAALPVTMRSRCQWIDVRLPPLKMSLDWLKLSNLPDVQANFLLQIAGNHPGRAAYFAQPEKYEMLNEVVQNVVDLALGKKYAHELVITWNDEDLSMRLHILMQLLLLCIWHALCRNISTQNSLPVELIAKIGQIDFYKLSQWWDQISTVCQQIKTPLRRDLLCQTLLSDLQNLLQSDAVLIKKG